MSTWKEASIQRSGVISDLWDVVMAYAGHAARWILFTCMCINIVQILPGVHLWQLVINIVLGTQVITLDIAGFGLSTLAKHARLAGEDKAATRAQWVSGALITLMILTIILVTASTLWPTIANDVKTADDVLILVRVGMVVLYSHTIHELREVTHPPVVATNTTIKPPSVPTMDEITAEVLRQLAEAQPAMTTTTRHDTTNMVEATPEASEVPFCTDTNVTSENDSEEESDTRQAPAKERILDYATRHPDATQQQIADTLGVSLRTVQRHLAQPKEAQKLKLVR